MEKQTTNLLAEMDDIVGKNIVNIEVLSNIDRKLAQLVSEMDTAIHRGHGQVYLEEYHQDISILSKLMYFVMNDMVDANESLETLYEEGAQMTK
ncbi:hypothetical protein [Lentibacillus saliphilus]|uniref:hypothetical protein n=1 Tax=Lentibacillus saliphilus TaxID=2737028 RepID=UPI001C2F674F|nr:hypothetical protein [Lentibacillus saliphilus]